MKTYKYINRPRPVEKQLYDDAIHWMVLQASQYDGVKSLYRFGNITTPGISDLDLLLVFEDEQTCLKNGFENLPDAFRPLFTHRIMAVSEKHFNLNQHYSLWSDHVLLMGDDLLHDKTSLRTPEETTALKIQTAVEFLVANYIDLRVQMEYGLINLRSFLQHMKGIIYDLEYLNITSGSVMNLLKELKHITHQWFIHTPSDTALNHWINKFSKEYESFCSEVLAKNPMYLPEQRDYHISRNAILRHSEKLNYQHKGLILPLFLSVFGKKISRLQNRFNHFEFGIPLTQQAALPIISSRFDFLREMKTYNRKFLPGFMTITTSITSKII